MKLENVDVKNKAKWYETRRNELLALLERTTDLGNIPEKYAKELKETRKKCRENQFEIVLIGEFQGGKSTTFDALCDGRDLSPRGFGIKTSATKISAQNISDGEKKNGMDEWAEIEYKSKYDLQKTMFDILYELLAQDDDFRRAVIKAKKADSEDDFAFRVTNQDVFPELLDLDDATHRTAVRRALDYWWKIYKEDKGSLNGDDALDRLRIATLIERFYGTPEYRRLIGKTAVGLGDFQKLVKFPVDWQTRWEKCEKSNFTLEDVAFVFVAQVLLRIKSENLARLGCRITDSPGLRANAYDTAVAESAILHADAVWYLLGNGKTVGNADKESLGKLKTMGMLHKMTGIDKLARRLSQSK